MKTFFSILINFVLILPAFAQDHHDHGKRIEALKVAFITQKLNLTPDQAQDFWPVYNSYQHELSDLYHQKRQNRMANKDNPNDALNQDMEIDNKILDTRKKYRKEFSKVLPPEKVLALFQAEREFREELIKELRARRQQDKP